MFWIVNTFLWFVVQRHPSWVANCCGLVMFLTGIFSAANGVAALFCFSTNTERVLRLARRGVIAGVIATSAAIIGTLANELLADTGNKDQSELVEELMVILAAAAVMMLSIVARKVTALKRRRPPPWPV